MQTLIDTPIDQMNIGLVKVLYELRQDLDIYCLISVNANKINEKGIGKSFFGHLQRLVFKSISLNICKIFEAEKKYQLNSIQGIFSKLCTKTPTTLDDAKVRDFIRKFGGPYDSENLIPALQSTIDGFLNKFKADLDRFKGFRDKIVAHSEYGITIKTLPSYDTMEILFFLRC